jgi:lysozyme
MTAPKTVSTNGVALLKAHEGLRLRAYDDLRPNVKLREGDDVEGTVTIGYGHTRTARPGQEITESEAELLLRRDLAHFERGVHKLAHECRVCLQQHEFDALVSFAYNVGLKALEDSTLWARVCEGKIKEAADEFLRWRFSKGRELPGLVKRRIDERSLFLGFKPERTA